ncbi:MAG: hypothetical protein HS116_19735 [Planctomycetes bacterium]|nr:hypothetical protein [Planctomycetota bacterium]
MTVKRAGGTGWIAALSVLVGCACFGLSASEAEGPVVSSRSSGVIVPTPHYTYDVSGGDLNTVVVNFNFAGSLPNAPTQAAPVNLFYRIILELNADCPPDLPVANPNVLAAGGGGSYTFVNLLAAPGTVIDPGPNGVLDYVAATDPADPLRNQEELAALNTDCAGMPVVSPFPPADDVIQIDPPPSNKHRVVAGTNLVADTQIRQNIVIRPGPVIVPGGVCANNPPGPLAQTVPALETIPQGDDRIGIACDTGGPVILAGPNNIADTIALTGVIIRPGPNGTIQTPANNLNPPPLGDDLVLTIIAPDVLGNPVFTEQVVLDGGNGCVDTVIQTLPDGTAVSDDLQVVQVGLYINNDVQVAPFGTSPPPTNATRPFRVPYFTDDIQIAPLGLPTAANKGALDTGWIDAAAYEIAIDELVPVTYSLPLLNPFQVDQVVCARLHIKVAVDINGTGEVDTTYDRLIRLTLANFSPKAELGFGDSVLNCAPVGSDVSFNVDLSQDQDGYFAFGAFEFGDERVVYAPDGKALDPISLFTPANLLLLPGLLDDFGGDTGTLAFPGVHQYSLPGNYKARLTLIDNGRIPIATPPVVTAPLPPAGASDPELQEYFQNVLNELRLQNSEVTFTPEIATSGVDLVLSGSSTVVILGDDFMDNNLTYDVIVDGGDRIADSTVRAIIEPGGDALISPLTVVGGDDRVVSFRDAFVPPTTPPTTFQQYVVDGGNGVVESFPDPLSDDLYLGGFTGTLQVFPPPDDPAWDEVQVISETAPTGPGLDPTGRYNLDPQLRQKTIQVCVKGNLQTKTGKFVDNFATPARDTFTLTGTLNAFDPLNPGFPFPVILGTSTVDVNLIQPMGGMTLPLLTGTLDTRGRIKDELTIGRAQFTYNPRTRQFKITVSKATGIEDGFDYFDTLLDPLRTAPLGPAPTNLKFGAAATTLEIVFDGTSFLGQNLFQFKSNTKSGTGSKPVVTP